MRILASAVIIGATVFSSVAIANVGTARESLNSLVARISSDENLNTLYATHFNKSVTDVKGYISALQAYELKRDTVFTIYVLNGEPQLKQLLAGSTVFVDAKERPILDAYGNPLVKPGDPNQDETKEEDDDNAPGGVFAAGSGASGLIATILVGGAVVYAADQARNSSDDVVPEPASLLVMSASLGLFASARRKRNK
jgi:hypothetical protein